MRRNAKVGRRKAVAGLRRLIPVTGARQAAPIRRQVLAEVHKAADTDRQSIRDAALFATLYLFGLRRSELVALDYAQRGDGQGVITLTADNIEVSLFTSKADPIRAVRVVVPKSGNPVASAAIESWIASAGLVPGAPFMRRFLGHGALGERISSDGVGRVVKRVMLAHFLRQGLSPADAAVDAARFTGHSGRIGLIVSVAEAGVSDTAIAKSTRHKTTALVARYAQLEALGEKRVRDITPEAVSSFALLIVLFMTTTGARVSEAYRLTVGDVDTGTLKALLRKTKNGKPRMVPLAGVLARGIERLIVSENLKPEDSVFGYAARWSVNQAIERVCAKASIRSYSSQNSADTRSRLGCSRAGPR